jgi:hypothetical protein
MSQVPISISPVSVPFITVAVSADVVPTDAVSADVVPADVVPADVVPADVVPADVVPADVVPADVVPADVVPADVVPADVVPADVVPAVAVSADVVPTDAVSADVVPADAVSADVVPTDAVSADVVPADVVPADVVPEDVVPADVVPEDAVPEDAVPADESDGIGAPVSSPKDSWPPMLFLESGIAVNESLASFMQSPVSDRKSDDPDVNSDDDTTIIFPTIESMMVEPLSTIEEIDKLVEAIVMNRDAPDRMMLPDRNMISTSPITVPMDNNSEIRDIYHVNPNWVKPASIIIPFRVIVTSPNESVVDPLVCWNSDSDPEKNEDSPK